MSQVPALQIVRWFSTEHLPEHLAAVVKGYKTLAMDLLESCPNGGPELTVAFRKLLESKDAAVRAVIQSTETDTPDPVKDTEPPPDENTDPAAEVTP